MQLQVITVIKNKNNGIYLVREFRNPYQLLWVCPANAEFVLSDVNKN